MEALFIILLIPFLQKKKTISFCYSKEETLVIKGFCATEIFIHHLIQNTSLNTVWHTNTCIVSIFVGIFFFLSGYGLMMQYQKRKEKYLQNFLIHKFGILCIGYLSVSLFYFLVKNLLGETITISEFIFSFFHGNPVATFSWYIIETLVLYLIFYLSCRFFKEDKKKILISLFLGILFYSFFCYFQRLGFWYYNVNLAFLFGVWFATREKKEIKHANLYLLGAFVCYPLTLVKAIFYQIVIVFFLLWLCSFLSKYKISSLLFASIGKISLPIYFMQGIPITIFKSSWILIENDFVFVFCSILLTLFLAILCKSYLDLLNKLKRGGAL